jgi:hypothetical protein
MPLHASTRNSKAAIQRKLQRQKKRDCEEFLGPLWAKDFVIEALEKQAMLDGLTKAEAEAEIREHGASLLAHVHDTWAKAYLEKWAKAYLNRQKQSVTR